MGCGAAKRLVPVGGWAKGIPKKAALAELDCVGEAGGDTRHLPRTIPLVVGTKTNSESRTSTGMNPAYSSLSES